MVRQAVSGCLILTPLRLLGGQHPRAGQNPRRLGGQLGASARRQHRIMVRGGGDDLRVESRS